MKFKLIFGRVIALDEDKKLQPEVNEMHLNKPSTIDDQQIK